MPTGAPRQIGKIKFTGKALADSMSESGVKITDPIKSIDLLVKWNYTTDSTVMTLTQLASNIGMLALVQSVELEGSNGYSQVFTREELLALGFYAGGAWEIEDISNAATTTAYEDSLILRLPVGITKKYESLTITINLSAAAITYSANAPTASAVTVEVGFNHGPVSNEIRTYKRSVAAGTEGEITDMPTVGVLAGIVDIMDIDAADTLDDYLDEVNHIELQQDNQMVTKAEGYAMILNMREYNSQLNMVPSKIQDTCGWINVDDVVLTNTEVTTVRQGATNSTHDVIFIVLRSDAAPNETVVKPYLNAPTEVGETNSAVPSTPEITDGGSSGQIIVGGGGVGFELPTFQLGGGVLTDGQIGRLRPGGL